MAKPRPLDIDHRRCKLHFVAEFIPPGFAEIIVPIKHVSLQRAAALVFGVELTTSGPDPIDVADDFALAWNLNAAGRLDSNVNWGPVEARVGQDGGVALAGVGSLTGSGSRSGDSPSPNVAVLIHLRTARGGRRGRGRKYVPWYVGETEVDETGTITPAVVTSCTTAFSNLRTALTSNGLDLCILHSSGLTPPGDPDLVTSVACDPRVATQRRRLR